MRFAFGRFVLDVGPASPARRRDGEHATIENLTSKNGTWVGAAKVDGPMPLTNGADLRMGAVVVVRFARDAATTQTVFPLDR